MTAPGRTDRVKMWSDPSTLPDPPSWTSILAGYNGSEVGGDAIRLAQVLAEATGAKLSIAHVLPAGETDARIQPLLEEVAADRGAEAVMTSDDSPGEGLLRLAAEYGAQLVVVGSSLRAPAGRVLEGRTAHRVLQGAPCAVAVAPRGFGARPEPPIGVIGVGYDGTVAAQYALAVAAELSQALRSKLRLIGVFDETPFRDAELAGSDGQFEHAERQQRDHLQRMLEGALRSLPPDLDASQDLRIGQPGAVLTEAARTDLDLLVVGSQGAGPLLEVNVGSTGRELLGSAPAAVLVAPLGVPADIAGALQ